MEAGKNLTPLSGLGIGFCTYKRKEGMIRLLDHIAIAAKALPAPPIVIVVDNDGSDPSVGEAVAEFSRNTGIESRYRIEKQPGISAARNAVFAETDALGVRYLAMIDDDEWPSPDWLAQLLRTSEEQKAVVVGGPVRPVFPDSAQQLRKWARYWSVDKQKLNGKPFVFCTCNFLLDMDKLRDEPRPFFDEAFGLSGGGDTVFFRKLFFRGHPMAWSDEAFIYEEVPVSRASLKWLRQRRFRVGNHAARWETLDYGKGRAFLKSLGLTVRLLFYPLYNREPDSRALGWLLEFDKVRGRFASHFGDVFVEYARPQQPGEKVCR
ncbi:glycosyltransferase family 2 protein [Derxia lacustris]|uniref:glycosyltransferase family 2 protein n=1 Tax=Derxia lacustris TaxID=764842 RepID=UPI000A1737B8|nr:glycosyltransferase family A protein [Derxia lacustris]